MPRRVKEEERIEMIIRGLLRQPENKRCINCNSSGPQYVCTTFWTFVCTSCSGVHREFTHRVKSVSMAKFNEEEITALQAGGNGRAREIYFKAWDPQRNNLPDNSNLQRVREFVKHVYVDRKYAGENSSNKLPMVKLGSRDKTLERHSSEKLSRGIRENFFERSSFERTSKNGRDEVHEHSSIEKSSPSKGNHELNIKDIFEERSPRNKQENMRSSGLKSCSTLFEIVDDRFREEGGVKRYERHSRKDSGGGSRSPGSERSRATSLPEIRPVSDIFGEKPPPLTINGPPRATNQKDAEGFARGQKAANTTIPGRTGGEEKQNETVNSSSLIDFDAQTESSNQCAEPQAQITAAKSASGSSPVASSMTPVAANALNMTSVESLLFDWSDAPSADATSAQLSSSNAADSGLAKAPEVSNGVGALAVTNMKHDETLHGDSRDHTLPLSQINQLHSKEQHQNFAPPPGNASSGAQQSAISVESLYNQLNKLPAQNGPAPVQTVELEKSSKAADTGGGSPTNGRKELPQDLFSSNFTAFSPAVAGWQMHQPHGAGYAMQLHHPGMSVAAFPSSTNPSNPFDVGDGRFQVQAAMFPSMSSLQGAVPNMAASKALESQPSPYAPALSSHASPYGMGLPLVPGAYMGQLPSNIPLTRPQGVANTGQPEDAFASLNPIQHASGKDTSPVGPNSLLSRGNPFG
ncbi:UNVERIFIED_CONTAM: putative ADP-ribosylation factor GTPase-activating protein AGD14 [Sesamum radiatum]|uniref:ADP-ribosylation factor GTPase-activating protein AGD14 n=1 Tax=Sesamum radiatum TaxID=300843 RepID=A0AAW2MIC3_SESRA